MLSDRFPKRCFVALVSHRNLLPVVAIMLTMFLAVPTRAESPLPQPLPTPGPSPARIEIHDSISAPPTLVQPVPGAPVEMAGPTIAPVDEMLEVDSRHLSCDFGCVKLRNPRFKFYRICPRELRRVPISADYLLDHSRGPVRHVIYVHGNRYTEGDAKRRGRDVFQRLRSCRTDGIPIRFVVFSWPSEKRGLAIRDARIKGERADCQALYLAWWLRHLLHNGVHPTIVSWSYGGRVTTGAMHVLAGGRLHGHCLPGETIRNAAINLALVAPAVASDCLHPRGIHGRGCENIGRMLLFKNRRDAVLRFYWCAVANKNVKAMGTAGVTGLSRRSDGSVPGVTTFEMSGAAKLQHSELKHYDGGAARRIAALIAETN
ncbi:MAG: alpha/beta hydrolase [Planctomycetota bacterium]